MIKLKPWGMFATPDDAKALQDWIECLSGGEKAVAYTAAGMAWNLAAKLTEGEPETHCAPGFECAVCLGEREPDDV
jgi:hypothetical protein